MSDAQLEMPPVAPEGGVTVSRRRRRAVGAGLAGAAALAVALGAAHFTWSASRVSVASITPPPPLSFDAAEVSKLTVAPPPGPVEQAAEIEELVALQARRDEAAKAEASYWQAGAVVRWNEIARGLVAKYTTSPPVASRAYALLSVAQHDALVAAIEQHRIHRRAPPSSADARVAPLFSAEVDSTYPSDHAAVAAASAAVLSFVYKSKAEGAALAKKAAEHEESRVLAGVSYRSDVVAGDTLGRAVAQRVIARAKTDGTKLVVPWDQPIPTGEGKWWSAEHPPVPPVRPEWARIHPWFLSSGSRIRPPPPPDFHSAEFKAAVDEIRRFSDTRTPEQLRIALFWADAQGTSTPPGHWNQIAADMIQARPTSQLAAARVLAFLNMAMMDAGIACWDAKYTYWLLRPVQADPAITLPVGLPNFPAYPSGHSTFSGAAAEVLAHFFPNDRDRLRAMAEEASMSRLYGGIHYRFDGETGLAMGRTIGQLAIEKERAGASLAAR